MKKIIIDLKSLFKYVENVRGLADPDLTKNIYIGHVLKFSNGTKNGCFFRSIRTWSRTF